MSRLKINHDGWNNPKSFCNFDTGDGRLVVSGLYIHHGAEFHFRATQQKSGPYIMRGHISAISPADGRILQVSGRQKRQILDDLEIKDPNYISNMAGKRISALNITSAVYPRSLNHNEIKASIADAVIRLYKKHAAYIHRVYGDVARPDTITPSVAAYKHVDKYLELNHPTLKANSCAAYRNHILSTCMLLPNVPMCQFSENKLKASMESLALSNHKKDLLRKFWRYCIDAKICNGKLPFPPTQKKRPAVDTLIRKAIRPDVLSIEEEDRVYTICTDNPTGPACGVALLIWGGHSAKNVCNFNWRDLIWSDTYNDYVRVRFLRNDLAGATHDYTAPLFPAGALILRARYADLLTKYSAEELADMPIVSQIKSPEVPMSPNALIQHATTMLSSVGITNAQLTALRRICPSIAVSSRILGNTYADRINKNCGLLNEPGTVKFLLHESLSDNVSDDHYTSFSDEEAGKHLYDIMSVVQPEREIDMGEPFRSCLTDKEILCMTPETTRQRVGLVATYKLMPGDELVIQCPHGVTGSIRARGINADGSLRRKTRKKSGKQQDSGSM